MVDPVVTCDGHTYERVAIERWLGVSTRAPLTGLPLANKTLVPNHAMRAWTDAVRAGTWVPLPVPECVSLLEA